MKTDDIEFNYQQNRNNEINKLSIALEKRIKEDRIINYISFFTILACFAFIFWSLV